MNPRQMDDYPHSDFPHFFCLWEHESTRSQVCEQDFLSGVENRFRCASRMSDLQKAREYSVILGMAHSQPSSDAQDQSNQQSDAHHDDRAASGPFQSHHHQSSSSVVLRKAGAFLCVQYSVVPSQEQENQTDSFCKRRARRTEMSKRLCRSMFGTSTAIEFASVTSRNLPGRKRQTHISHISSVLTRAHADVGSLATTSRRPKLWASSSRRSCAGSTRGISA